MHTERKKKIALLSVASNATLVLLKIAAGLWMGSVAVISEAIHSLLDLLASLIAYFSVRLSGKPADREHPFGHGKIENLSGAIEALLIFVAAGWIIVEAVKKMVHPEPVNLAGLGAGVMLVSAVANWIISGKLFRVGRETDSIALQADAWHLRTDVYTSAGVMAGMLVIVLGNRMLPRLPWHWVDPLAALIVAAMILRAAWHLTLQAGRDLIDSRLPPEEEGWIATYLRSLYPTVKGWHLLRTRKSGAERFVDFHLLVSPDETVDEAHRLTGLIKAGIRARLEGAHVTIHVEPCDGSCKPECLPHCLLNETERGSAQQRRAAMQACG